jgi:hypothetical protein
MHAAVVEDGFVLDQVAGGGGDGVERTPSSQVGTTSTKVSTRFFWTVVVLTGGWAKAGAPTSSRPAPIRPPSGDEP